MTEKKTTAPGELETRLKHLIVEKLRLEDVDPTGIGDNDPLFGDEGLGLDSVDALELVVAVEQAFGIKIEDEEVGQQAFQSVSSLADFVRQKLDG